MSDLKKEYKENGNTKIPFTLEKIIKQHANGGFGIQAWDDKDLQTEVDALVKKGLIDYLGGGEYKISDEGIKWKDDTITLH